MKLKTLSIVAAVLAVASIAAWLFNQRDTGASADPRVGEPLLTAGVVAKIAAVHFKTDNKEITLTNTDPAGSAWVVKEYHDMPVDFPKLTRLIADLREAKVIRFVSANPERLERMEFGDAEIDLRDKEGATIWEADLGKTPSGGGRFIKFAAESRAYLTGMSAWLDSTAKNWVNATLIPVKPEDVTALEIVFPEGEPLKMTRDSSSSSWKVEGLAEGEQLKESPVSSLLSSLTNLRFTETTEKDAPEAVAAREHSRTLKLTTKDARTYTIVMGRQPAPPAPPPPPPPAEGETAPPAPPEPKAGPVYAFITSSLSADPINAMMDKRAFQVSEWSFTGLPADREALIEKEPPPEAPPATDAQPSAPEAGDSSEEANNAPSAPAPTSFPDATAEAAYIAQAFADYKTLSDGIRYKVLREGAGEKPSAGARVQAHYAGRLLDGTEFDSSYKINQPFSFVLGQGQVIQGWDKALLDMKTGEKRTVVIPYKLGYGERGAGGDIPPRATLVFDIELVSVSP